MATKKRGGLRDDQHNIIHEKIVSYTNSVGCKIGTKTLGQTIDGIVFRDVDVVKAGPALNIDVYDTAVAQNTRFDDIRIEAVDSSIIALEEANPRLAPSRARTTRIAGFGVSSAWVGEGSLQECGGIRRTSSRGRAAEPGCSFVCGSRKLNMHLSFETSEQREKCRRPIEGASMSALNEETRLGARGPSLTLLRN